MKRGHSVKYKGFTLIELLVVIAIISILSAILFPVFARVRMGSWYSSSTSCSPISKSRYNANVLWRITLVTDDL